MKPEVSAAVWLTDDVLLGAEYRDKPNNLARFPRKQRRGRVPRVGAR